MRRLLPLLLAACSVDRSTTIIDEASDGGMIAIDYSVFGACPGTDKVRGIDPASGAVQCAADNDQRELPPRYRWGLEVETSGAASVRIRPGECRDRDDTMDIELAAVDDVALGTPGDSELFVEGPDTWYYVWIIADSNRVNEPYGFLSVSSSSPVYPAGYDRGRLLAAVRNDAASDFLPFSQTGKTSVWVNQREILVYEGSAPAADVYAAVAVWSVAPPGTEVVRVLYVNQLSTTSSGVWFRDPDVPDVENQVVTSRATDGAGHAVERVPVGGTPGGEYVEFKRSLGDWNWMMVQGYAWGPQEP